MRTTFKFDAASKAYVLEFKVPSKLAPLQMGMVLFHPATGSYEGPNRGFHCCVPIGMLPGDPCTLGATLAGVAPASSLADTRCSVNFAVFSAHASAMSLCLMRSNSADPGTSASGFLEIALDPAINKTGDVWHVCVKVGSWLLLIEMVLRARVMHLFKCLLWAASLRPGTFYYGLTRISVSQLPRLRCRPMRGAAFVHAANR